MSRARITAVVAASLALAACYEDRTWVPRGEARARNAPNVSMVATHAYPPYSSIHPLRVQVVDVDGDLVSLGATFHGSVQMPIAGTGGDIALPMIELGDGKGTLSVEVVDRSGNRAGLTATNIVIDTRPPVITEPLRLLLHDGETLAMWIADDWALASIEFEVDGHAVGERSFPKAYPATAGQAWDDSLEEIGVSALSPGFHQLRVTAVDAGGNTSSAMYTFRIDTEAPVVEVVSPTPDAHVAGKVAVVVHTTDDGDEPVLITARLGGLPVGEAFGPKATIAVDTTGFAKGTTDLELRATDGAGNESEPVVVSIVVD